MTTVINNNILWMYKNSFSDYVGYRKINPKGAAFSPHSTLHVSDSSITVITYYWYTLSKNMCDDNIVHKKTAPQLGA